MASVQVRYIVRDVPAAIAFYTGWNRFAVMVDDREAKVAELRKAGVRFRNDLVAGVGGKQIIAEDASGNPVELFQPTRPPAT